MEQDKQYLQLTGIFHFVVGGIAGLLACFPIIHFVIGISMFFAALANPKSVDAAPFSIFGLMFTIIPGLMIAIGWVFAICVMLAGYFLLKRRNHTYCLVMACIECIFMPFGTVLGVLTILLLLRPEVKALFASTLPPVIEQA